MPLHPCLPGTSHPPCPLQSFLPLHACFAGAAAAPAGVADAVDVVVVRTAPLAAGASVLGAGAGAGDDEGESFEHPDAPSKSPATAADTSDFVVFMRQSWKDTAQVVVWASGSAPDQCPAFAPSQRSASSAAMHPLPAAVTACR
jgi:hypothetical protein